MRIVIDLQGAQSPSSAHRGLGKYALSLALALARNRAEHEIIVALNGLFPNTIEPIRAAFDGLLPQENIRIWQAVGPVYQMEPAHNWRRKTAVMIRDAFLASLRPDIVYLSSLFEGWQDDAVTSIGLPASSIPTIATLYDLIPLSDQQAHSQNPALQAWYESKLHQLKRADFCLAISASTRSAGIEQLGLIEHNVIDIGVDEHPQPKIQLSGVMDRSHFEYCPAADEPTFWDETARKVWATFTHLYATLPRCTVPLPLQRPKLAYVSPLPPERSGIADYSAEILPELAHYYDIDVISNQSMVSDLWVAENYSLHDANWLMHHADEYDRVLYHFGNSPFHQHMFELLKKVPGVVVLHDFYLSDLVAYLDMSGVKPGAWATELYNAHGYLAVSESFTDRGNASANRLAVKNYPCNLQVHQHALGVIVHANYSKQLADVWYGSSLASSWSVVPLPRTARILSSSHAGRPSLGLKSEDFVVCSFGMLGFNKLNHRLLDAWLASPLAQDCNCYLVFVGENDGGEYGSELLAAIHTSGIAERIKITGWTDTAQYRAYLETADVGVQLRTSSRGETSAAVLDCLNYGLPTIVNSNGAMAELSRDAVWMLDEEFADDDLIAALTKLRKDEDKRALFSVRARDLIRTRHVPRHCAQLYAAAIEGYYRTAENDSRHLVEKISFLANPPQEDAILHGVAKSIAQNLPKQHSARQLLVDVSAIMQNDLKTGIQRVVRALLIELIKAPPAGYRIEPVYLTDRDGYWHYMYARRYALEIMGCSAEKMVGAGTPETCFEDDHLEAQPGDLMAVLDFTSGMVVEAEKFGVFGKLKEMGVSLWFVVYDLLPILQPHVFPPETESSHTRWLTSVCRLADGVLCISRAVADELTEWQKNFGPTRFRPLKIESFHLGADVSSSVPTIGLPANAKSVLDTLSQRPTFLMVGTVEPRKGQAQTLKAFELLWKQDLDINLVIVGKQGWMMESLIDSIKAHDQLDQRLFWMTGISDEFLEKIYAAATCLISASEGEGFGLPLIEAAQHKLPIIARDIPVFREVVGEHGFYFTGLAPNAFAECVREWLTLNEAGQAPQSDTMPWLTWKQSTQNLLDVMLGGQRHTHWMKGKVLSFRGSDSRMSTQVGKRTNRDMVSTGKAGYLLYGPCVPLLAGKYQVIIRGTVGKNGLARAHMDIGRDKGGLILGKSGLSKPDENDILVTLPISLDVPCSDLEVRVWVSNDTDLQVSMIEIAPWQGEQEASNTDPEVIAGGDSLDRDVVLIEPAGQQQSAQVLSFAPTATEPSQDVAKVEAKVVQQELTASSALVRPVLSMASDKFAVIDDDSDAAPALQSAEVEILSDHAQASNDASAPRVMAIPSAVQNKWKPSSTERNRAKADRKKKR